MLDSLRHQAEALPRISANFLISTGTLTSFVWLLLTNRIPAIYVFLLEVYLTF
jgi:hypothetical protein